MKKNLFFGFALFGMLAMGAAHATEAGWPRKIETSHGVVTLQQPPTRIVSTSVTVTGTLLAIDAPVIASGATTPGSRLADSQGFFHQWSAIATQRGVKRLYIGEPNAEAIAGEAPDLIIISATGADSAVRLYDQLSAIAPVLVVNYDDKSWQALAIELGQATGHEAKAQKIVDDFDSREKSLKQRMTLPEQPTSALVFSADGKSANLWTAESSQGQMLKQLGFTLAVPSDKLNNSRSMGMRKDIIQLAGENLAEGLNGQTLMLFANNESDAQRLMANPFLAHLPAVQHKRVYALGNDTFRLDYYSASNLLTLLEKQFISQ
ncbi:MULTISPECIES: Fe2+-enterobactin ABC transporter substrate-binding protein [Serratia]|jgi:ferric enterobactin transport system substrate-binding protein|uniref:Fe2+-enterobactin ABC transporter substrate-binding protein n=1 Tax=Serratia TaxID=613 RepID=UPI0003584888|nr:MULTISPECIES: Fe2+-enterobactin ABC transporter substrate-binding protein [Serratia]AGQ32214.1 antibiotic ABC transporter substrate-binding protein [Serratia liquefaciens ATCC 27592]AKE09448.1 iron-enterobactin ABC transporter substrate-binding protein [Serratia liquefaciens]AYO39193.1 Fe2+-enterobactin ABC transporter substrate-binding protein [Serratia sp. P2ACOL2]MBF8106126.1 Fe2+-enterobactin ABC transporter substrate-binding protein [Serratia liquefaciens]MBH2811549.1 Fe2+-enterobactin